MLESTEVIIQSKSSSLPVYLLFKNIIDSNNPTFSTNLSTHFDVIDCCAAPGNKTMQAAEYLNNRGKVYAFEKSVERFNLLQERVNKYGFEDVIES